MKTNFKLAALAIPFFFLISCSDSDDVQESKITWDATNGVIAHSLKDYNVVEAAYKSGCIGLHIGIESGNPEKVLKCPMDRPVF